MHIRTVNEGDFSRLRQGARLALTARPAALRRFRQLATTVRSRAGLIREDGQTLIMFVLFMFVLILFVGLGIDLGFAYITRARLSKAVDAACLAGIRNVNQTQATAQTIADSTFRANYGTSARDVPPVLAPVINFGTLNNNITIDVSATRTISTFFLRIFPALDSSGPSWRTLTVGSHAQATRPNLIMSLVLDRSGSMVDDGGAAALPGAVSDFIDRFDDSRDRVGVSSFASGSTIDLAMSQPFKQAVKDTATAIKQTCINNYNRGVDTSTCAERGLTNGLALQQTVVPASGEEVIRVIVFFTDGVANTWYNTMSCGARDIYSDGSTYDPNTGASQSCSGMPHTLPSIDPITGVVTANAITYNSCAPMHQEAQRRAERIACLSRAGSLVTTGGKSVTTYVYSIGLGSGYSECGFPALNPDFLKNVANTLDSDTHVQGQLEGDYAIAADPSQLDAAFQDIADKILARLTK